jgi:hypothetical protein
VERLFVTTPLVVRSVVVDPTYRFFSTRADPKISKARGSGSGSLPRIGAKDLQKGASSGFILMNKVLVMRVDVLNTSDNELKYIFPNPTVVLVNWEPVTSPPPPAVLR